MSGTKSEPYKIMAIDTYGNNMKDPKDCTYKVENISGTATIDSNGVLFGYLVGIVDVSVECQKISSNNTLEVWIKSSPKASNISISGGSLDVQSG
jgi:hypothetical protein